MTEHIVPQPRAQALGGAIDWTPKDLAALSTVTLPDLKAALALWHASAPARYKTLLLAEREVSSGFRPF
jgi:hypothetical protein